MLKDCHITLETLKRNIEESENFEATVDGGRGGTRQGEGPLEVAEDCRDLKLSVYAHENTQREKNNSESLTTVNIEQPREKTVLMTGATTCDKHWKDEQHLMD